MTQEFYDLLDPSQWKEEPEVFPGYVQYASVRDAHPRYKQTLGIPEDKPYPQFVAIVRRYDRKFVNERGEEWEAPIRVSVDLLRRIGRGEEMRFGSPSRRGKTALVLEGWRAVFGDLNPPESLVGLKAMWKYYREYNLGGVAARDVLIPVEILDASYQYTGPVRKTTVRSEREIEETETATTETEEQALLALRDAVIKAGSVKSLISALSYLDKQYQKEPYMSWILSGAVLEKLKDAGLVEIDDGGKIVAA